MDKLLEDDFTSFDKLHDIIKDSIDLEKDRDVKRVDIAELSFEDIDILGNEYKLYYSKLKYIKLLADDVENRSLHIENILNIDNFDFISSKEKMRNILSYAVLAITLEDIKDFSEDELILLYVSLNQVKASEYKYYLDFLMRKEVLTSIINVRENLAKRNILVKDIIKEVDKKPFYPSDRLIDIAFNVIQSSREMSK